MDPIIQYIEEKYHPSALIVYGSYADGSHNAHSDFDALAIAGCPACHDVSFVGDIQLDLFVYPPEHFQGDLDCDEFMQIFDGQVLIDADGLGAALRDKAQAYVDGLSPKPLAAVAGDVEWCRKMQLRTQRGDPEGMFRWHWLLTESLAIFCDMVSRPYLGPKKTLRWMKDAYPNAYAAYTEALEALEADALEAWIGWLETKLRELQGQA